MEREELPQIGPPPLNFRNFPSIFCAGGLAGPGTSLAPRRWREGVMYYGLGGVILLIIILIVTGRI